MCLHTYGLLVQIPPKYASAQLLIALLSRYY